jgi:integrase/recombinase XerD
MSFLGIVNAKGKKDRVIPISDKVIVMLREYYKIYRPRIWLFEGQEPGTKFSETSLQKVLKHALDQAKIKKPVTLHWLRHRSEERRVGKECLRRCRRPSWGRVACRCTDCH